MRILALIVLIGVFSVGCTPQDTTAILTPLVITSGSELIPVVDVPYNKELEANKKVKWSAIMSDLPDGLRFEKGIIIGEAKNYGETGSLTVEAVCGKQTVLKTFTVRVIDAVWINQAKITVSNFYAGARAEYLISVHNDESLETERKIVTTDATDEVGENGIAVLIPLKYKLNDGAEITVEAVNPQTELLVGYYDKGNNAVYISGFLPMTQHEIKITYVSEALFGAVYENIDSPLGVDKMVTVEPPMFYLKPHETKEILVVLEMPKEYKIAVETLSFQIVVGKTSSMVINSMQTNIRYACKWIVNMR